MDGFSSAAFSWTTSKTVKIDYKATWDERNRYKNQFVLRWNDEKNPGKMSIQDDFKKGSQISCYGESPGMGNACVPPSGRFRQRPIDKSLRSHFRWQSQIWRQIYGSQASSSSSSTTWWEPSNGKNDKIGTDDRNGMNEYRFLEPPSL